MNIRFAKNEDRQIWDAFAREHSFGTLQQSWVWGEFQEDYGFKVFRIIVEEKNEILGIAQAMLYDMPFGKWYLYVARGPLVTQKLSDQSNKVQVFDLILKELENIALKNKAVFTRIDPCFEKSKPNAIADKLKVIGKKSFKQVQPEETLMIDLSGSEDELLASMKSKWRYNIKLAQKKDIKITTPKSGGVDAFYELAKSTSERNAFYYHPKKYYEKLVNKLGNRCSVFVATYKDIPIASSIMFYFKNTAIYAHGASSDEHKNLMAPHLIQWEAIRNAKGRGFDLYDFYGIATEGEKLQSWQGITRFKMGFAPEGSKFARHIKYVGAYDIVYDKFSYGLIRLAKKLKGKK